MNDRLFPPASADKSAALDLVESAQPSAPDSKREAKELMCAELISGASLKRTLRHLGMSNEELVSLLLDDIAFAAALGAIEQSMALEKVELIYERLGGSLPISQFSKVVHPTLHSQYDI